MFGRGEKFTWRFSSLPERPGSLSGQLWDMSGRPGSLSGRPGDLFGQPGERVWTGWAPVWAAWGACLGGLGVCLGGMRGLLGGLEACLGDLACMEGLEKPNLREGSLEMNFRPKSSKRAQESPRAPREPKSSKRAQEPRTFRSRVEKHLFRYILWPRPSKSLKALQTLKKNS